MKKANTIITLVWATLLLFSFENNSSGQEINIGDQTWAIPNLNVNTFRNGDAIPEAKTVEDWVRAGNAGKPAWCYFNNDSVNEKKYGKLYNWFAVTDPRGLAPNGWHVPSDEEWTTLTDHLGGEAVAGAKMKHTCGWEGIDGTIGNGTNESGFAGLPGGYRYWDGSFYFIGSDGYWWVSTEHDTTDAWHRYLDVNDGDVNKYASNKQVGFSVRCLRD